MCIMGTWDHINREEKREREKRRERERERERGRGGEGERERGTLRLFVLCVRKILHTLSPTQNRAKVLTRKRKKL